MACLSFKVVVLHLDVAKLELEGPLGVTQGGNFLLQSILCAIGFGFALLVLGLDAAVSTSGEAVS